MADLASIFEKLEEDWPYPLEEVLATSFAERLVRPIKLFPEASIVLTLLVMIILGLSLMIFRPSLSVVEDTQPLRKGQSGIGAESARGSDKEPEDQGEEQEDPKLGRAVSARKRALTELQMRPWRQRSPEKITNSIGMELILISAGGFMMGSPKHEEGRGDHEGPPHRVRITRPFYIGKYEVTQEQYEAIMGENPSRFKGPNNPIEMVSWHDAVEFCRRLSEMEGREYGLPTEAEWEYACRAGSSTPFCYGDDPGYKELGDYAWYGGNSEGKAQAVGQKRPNAWGLYDMHGNVWEWCADWYDGDYYKNSPVDDPKGPPNGTYRVLRGGSWNYYPSSIRSAHRSRYDPAYSYYNIGFRVVLRPRSFR